MEEFKRDPGYHKVHEDEARLQAIVDRAWRTGADAARRVMEKYRDSSFFAIVRAYGLTVEKQDVDCVIGGLRYFSDYYSGTSKIIKLYTKSIRKWADENDMTLEEAEEAILAHELFHHLECTELGHTSKQYQVPMLEIGPLRIGRTGMRALSEIGAHAFARTCLELRTKSGRPKYKF